MLQKIEFLPGFNKQVTPTGAEGEWTGGDYVRFRYGTPEKIGGWSQLGENFLTGAARAQHQFINSSGFKYSAIGTNRILYVYTGGVFYDIHPIKSTTTLTSAFTTTNASTAVTITFSSPHNMTAGDIIYLDNFTTITNSNYTASDFNDVKFMITTVSSSTTITITMSSAETGSGATTSGGIRVQHYYPVGPATQLPGYGWSLGQWGGTVSGEATTTLNGGINDATTTIVLTDASQFPSSGTCYVQIDSEEISYTGISGNTLTGVTREVRNTSKASHSNGATVTNSTDYVAWGEAASGDYVLDPGLWTLDSFGKKLLALIHNGPIFEWDSDSTTAISTRATIVSGAPTASRDMLVSTPDRHLVLFGTETTIGDAGTQDDMFVRWSNREDITTWAITSTNTAGSQRLSDGSRIMGAVRGRDATYVWTDSAAFTMRFVGVPFVFAFTQVGTNCGLLGMNAAIEVDGTAYWMSENGFFKYAGKLESMKCLVEDYVFDDLNTTGQQLVNCGLNNLFGEIYWFYPTSGSTVVNRMVSYNYLDSTPERSIWVTSSLSRTTWTDSSVFGDPHGTSYDADTDTSYDVVGNTEGRTTYFKHETGTDQVVGSTTTAITSNIESGDYDITVTKEGGATFQGDGEFLMKIRRFIPDFVSQTGDTQITLNLRDYPNSSQASSSLGPFTISSSTTKVDTRARARAVSLKIANTSTSQDWKLGTFRVDVQPDGRR